MTTWQLQLPYCCRTSVCWSLNRIFVFSSSVNSISNRRIKKQQTLIYNSRRFRYKYFPKDTIILASITSRMVAFWYSGLPGMSWKMAVNECCCWFTFTPLCSCFKKTYMFWYRCPCALKARVVGPCHCSQVDQVFGHGLARWVLYTVFHKKWPGT